MRIVAIVLNIIVLITSTFLLKEIYNNKPIDMSYFDEGDYAEIIFYVIILFCVAANLGYLIFTKTNSWLFLFLKRKALEEQKKIETLSADKSNKRD